MLRAADKTSVIVIAEDDSSSRVLKSAVVDQHAVKVVVGHRKANVYGALAELSEATTIGVVDADYERAEGLRPPARCFWFDNRDLEVMLICSAAFDRIVEELTNGMEDAPALRNRVLNACSVIGTCRLNSYLSGSGVSFAGIRPETFYDSTSAEVDAEALFCWLSGQNPRLPPRWTLLTGSGLDGKDINRGHDMSAVVAADLRANHLVELGAADIERLLRLSVRRDDFTDSQLFQQLAEWESIHDCVILAA